MNIKATRATLTGVNIPSKNGYTKHGIAVMLECIADSGNMFIGDKVHTERLVMNVRTKEVHSVAVGSSGEWCIAGQRGLYEALVNAAGTELIFDTSLDHVGEYNAGYISDCTLAVTNYGVCDGGRTWRHDDAQGESTHLVDIYRQDGEIVVLHIKALSQALAEPNVMALIGDSSLVDRYDIGFRKLGQFNACIVESLKCTLGPCSFLVRYFTIGQINIVTMVDGDGPDGQRFRSELAAACANTGIPCNGDPIGAMSYHYSNTLTAIAQQYHDRWDYNSSGNINFTGVLRNRDAAFNILKLIGFVTGKANLLSCQQTAL